MVEDALKSARGLHRLIMTVALVVVVFSLSIESPPDKKLRRQVVEGIIELPLANYSAFVNQKVDETAKQLLAPISEKVSEKLGSGGHLVFGIDDLAEAFSEPIHVGQLLVHNTILNEIENASLTQLDALNGFELDRDVELLIPETDELVDQIEQFLTQNGRAGRRIDTVQLNVDDFSFDVSSFLPGETQTAAIYFELLDAVRVAGAPVFSANFTGKMRSIPDSSYLDWLAAQEFKDEYIKIESGQLKFASELLDLPNGFNAEKLGQLSLRLQDEINKSSPASQSVSILGTSIPGGLVVFAAPLILLFLCYYFSCHTSHLSRIALENIKDFQTFAWLPLSLPRIIGFELINRSKKAQNPDAANQGFSSGLLEAFFSVILLPTTSIGLLFFRLNEFGPLSPLQLASLGLSCIGVILFGWFSLKNIAQVRRVLEAAKAGTAGRQSGQG